MKTWQEQVQGELRRLDAVGQSLLNIVNQAGGPAEPLMAARDLVCGAIVTLTAMNQGAASSAMPPTPAGSGAIKRRRK